MSLFGIFVAAVSIASPTLFSSAATSTTATIGGAKILSTGGGQYGGSINGSFSNTAVTVTRQVDKTSTNSLLNPFMFSGLTVASGGDQYKVSVVPNSANGYSLVGSTWCADACAGFNALSTNFKSGSVLTLTLQRNHNYHIRWIYAALVTPTQPPPVPTPVPTVLPAPIPGPITQSSPASLPSRNPPAVQPTQTAPSAPTNFEAFVDSGIALVNLSWTEIADAASISAYRIERSTDQSQWTVLSENLAAVEFRDDQVAFATHYYYRVSAIGQGGISSEYVFKNVDTGTFAQNATSAINGNFASADETANVLLVAGTLDADAAICNVITSHLKLTKSVGAIIAGPYELVCKNTSGKVLTDFNKPVTWKYNLKSKNNGYGNFRGVSVGAGGRLDAAPTSDFDSQSQQLTFNQSTATTTAVLAASKRGIPAGSITIIVIVFIFLGWVIFNLRASQRQRYTDFLRSKYYNL